MAIIFVDTAHEIGYVARENELILMEGARHSETAAPFLERLWREGPVSEIWVGVGPGSYTGLRVGLALAQGLHLATGTPLMGYCSLEAYWTPGTLSLFDARAGGVYCWDGRRAFRASIEELKERKERLVSPDAEKIGERLGHPVEQASLSLQHLSACPPMPIYLKELAR